MQSNPKVSVIIPAYNVGEYIEKCVRSVVNQSYNNLEIIVVNDGSKDNTLSIISQLAEENQKIKVIDKKNGGVSAARNDGMQCATGDYLVFVDGDDFLAEDFVEFMLELFVKTGGDFCMSTDCFMYKTDKQAPTITIKKITADEATALLLSPKVEVGCWNKMFKSDFIKKHELQFDTTLFYGEGLNFITRASQCSQSVGITNKKIYYYRQNNTVSATKKFDVEKIVNGWKALDCIGKRLDDKMPRSNRMLEQHRCLFSFNAVRKIQSSDTQKVNKSVYKYHLSSIRKRALKEMFSAALNWKMKIKLAIACIAPWVIGGMDKRAAQIRSKKSI